MQRYRALLANKQALRLLIASMVSRYPLSMMPLGLLLLSQQRLGSFALGGLAAGLHALASAITAPIYGRWADRVGARPILLATGIGYPVMVGVLIAALYGNVVTPLFLILVCLAGATMPTAGAIVRTAWRQFDDDLRETAFALEAVVIEVVYITGPILVSIFILLAIPAWAIAGAAIAASAGTFLVISSGRVPGPAPVATSQSFAAPLRSARMILLLLAVFGVLFGMGTIDLAIAGFAGGGALAGFLLAIWSIGSCIGGLWFGLETRESALAARYRWALCTLFIGQIPLVLAAKPLVLAVLLLLAGATIAPTMATQAALVGEVAEPGATTESYTWVSTTGYLGLACGAAAGGFMVESVAGVPGAFLLGAAGSAFALLMATLGQWIFIRLLTTAGRHRRRLTLRFLPYVPR